MRGSADVSAILRTMKLWRDHPIDPARIEHGVKLVEPLLVPFLSLRDAGDLAEIPDNSGLPLAPLTQAMRDVSASYCGKPGYPQATG